MSYQVQQLDAKAQELIAKHPDQEDAIKAKLADITENVKLNYSTLMITRNSSPNTGIYCNTTGTLRSYLYFTKI